jgi:DNA-binding protein HU-beta
MTKADIVRHMAATADLTQVQAAEALTAVFDALQSALQQGNTVMLRRFGSFQVRHKGARSGRNPKTGQAAEIPARRVVRFYAARQLKTAVNAAPSVSGEAHG